MNYYAAVRAFLTTSEAGSFSVAAKRLSVKASTVSHYVSDLEEKLGGPLFSRSTRGVILTERGAKFRGFAQRAVNALDEALATASSFRSEHVDGNAKCAELCPGVRVRPADRKSAMHTQILPEQSLECLGHLDR
jgi:DNA-binding transcriptional LysR family regulator